MKKFFVNPEEKIPRLMKLLLRLINGFVVDRKNSFSVGDFVVELNLLDKAINEEMPDEPELSSREKTADLEALEAHGSDAELGLHL